MQMYVRHGTARTCRSHNSLDLFHVLQFRRQSSVHTENLFIDYCSHWQAVEAVSEGFPKFDVVSSLA